MREGDSSDIGSVHVDSDVISGLGNSGMANTLATIKYASDIVNSVSGDKKDISMLGDIVTKFTSPHSQDQGPFSPKGPGSYGMNC